MPPDHLSGRHQEFTASGTSSCDLSAAPSRYGHHWFILEQAPDAYADQLATRIEAE